MNLQNELKKARKALEELELQEQKEEINQMSDFISNQVDDIKNCILSDEVQHVEVIRSDFSTDGIDHIKGVKIITNNGWVIFSGDPFYVQTHLNE